MFCLRKKCFFFIVLSLAIIALYSENLCLGHLKLWFLVRAFRVLLTTTMIMAPGLVINN
jgi:hypothetical protein